MKKYQTIVRIVMAVAIAFGVQTTANAQLGGLVNKAKKAVKEKVEKKTKEAAGVPTATSTADPASSYRKDPSGRTIPTRDVDKVKYIEGTATPERQKVYDYCLLEGLEASRNTATSDYSSTSRNIMNWLFYIYNGQANAQYSPTYWMKEFDNIAKRINTAFELDQEPAEMADYFDAELIRAKVLYLQKYATELPQMSEQDQAAWLKQRKDERAIAKYGLNTLKDNGQNGELKRSFEAKVKATLKPTKMLGTYIVSAFWQGLYIVNKPEFEQYSSVQEMRVKAYYMNDGKYYYVKGGKRHATLKSDPSNKSVDLPDYNPGLETPIEIPAELAKKYFK
ncbi:MAG: hypothetical protein SPL55_02960 [Prevotella sp.]|nr:hypothetical protein [Prevotella sp.]